MLAGKEVKEAEQLAAGDYQGGVDPVDHRHTHRRNRANLSPHLAVGVRAHQRPTAGREVAGVVEDNAGHAVATTY